MEEQANNNVRCFSGSGVLHNTGGPHSRVRTEAIKSSIFKDAGLKEQQEVFRLHVEKYENDIEGWVTQMAKESGYETVEQAALHLKLPGERMIIIERGPAILDVSRSTHTLLKSALVLSRCNKTYYNPDSPMIFTRNRLHRYVELIKINLDAYYGME